TNTAQIGTFKILSETGVAAGVRRIEAVTGRGAIAYYTQVDQMLSETMQLLKTKKDGLVKKIENMMQEQKNLQKENEKLHAHIAKQEAGNILEKVEMINELKVLVTEVPGLDMNGLRNMGDTLKDQLGESVVVLASHKDEKVSLIAMTTKGGVDLGINCGQIIAQASKVVGGGGGGRPNMAQAGGKDIQKISEALDLARNIVGTQCHKM
ncbi:MAG: DHHA1 domain-containing protein, partial [Cellulosilyticaceae bacterium]